MYETCMLQTRREGKEHLNKGRDAMFMIKRYDIKDTHFY